MSQALGEINWNGREIKDCLLIPITGEAEEWLGHPGYTIAVADPEQPQAMLQDVCLLWDDDDDMLMPVAYAFIPGGKWDDATAREFVNQHLGAESSSPGAAQGAADAIAQALQRWAGTSKQAGTPASLLYLRKLVELLAQHVKPQVLEELRATARGYAGGKLHGKASPEEGAPPSVDPEPTQEQQEPQEQQALEPSLAYAAEGSQSMAIVTSWAGSEQGSPKPYRDPETGDIWKCISRVGEVYQATTGQIATITRDIILSCYESFGHTVQYVDVPIGHHWDRPDLNTGFVTRLSLEDHPDGLRLWGLFHFTEPEIKAKAERGSIADVSVWIEPNLTDPDTGRQYAWSLWHCCLTNKPVMTKLGAFSTPPSIKIGDRRAAIFMATQPAQHRQQEAIIMAAFEPSATVKIKAENYPGLMVNANGIYFVKEAVDGAFYVLLDSNGQEIRYIAEADLTAADPAKDLVANTAAPAFSAQRQAAAAVANLSQEDLDRALQAQGFSLAQFGQLRDTSRSNRVKNIVHAMEGKIQEEGVQQEEGYRHHPAVVIAVEKALKEEPSKLKFSVGMDGSCSLDAAILSIVNAIPKEARVLLSGGEQFALPQVETPLNEGDRATGNGSKELPSVEDIRAYEATLPGSRQKFANAQHGKAAANGKAS